MYSLSCRASFQGNAHHMHETFPGIQPPSRELPSTPYSGQCNSSVAMSDSKSKSMSQDVSMLILYFNSPKGKLYFIMPEVNIIINGENCICLNE